jgi:hypothetical protein
MNVAKPAPLRPEDLALLDYLIARAIDDCIDSRRKATRERQDREATRAA